jgi:ParB family chromosome partitioning protein
VQRHDLNPIEEARAFGKYVSEYGWGGVRKLATTIGKSPAYISQRLSLLKLPNDVKDLLEAGEIYPSAGRELIHADDPSMKSVLASLASDGNASVRDLRECITHKIEDWVPEYSEEKDIDSKKLDKSVLIMRIAMSRISDLLDRTDDDVIKEYIRFEFATIHNLTDGAIRLSMKRCQELRKPTSNLFTRVNNGVSTRHGVLPETQPDSVVKSVRITHRR